MKTKKRLIAALFAATISMTTLPVSAGGERADVIVEWNQLLQANAASDTESARSTGLRDAAHRHVRRGECDRA